MKTKIDIRKAKEFGKTIGGFSMFCAGLYLMLVGASDNGYKECVKYVRYCHPEEYKQIVERIDSMMPKH